MKMTLNFVQPIQIPPPPILPPKSTVANIPKVGAKGEVAAGAAAGADEAGAAGVVGIGAAVGVGAAGAAAAGLGTVVAAGSILQG